MNRRGGIVDTEGWTAPADSRPDPTGRLAAVARTMAVDANTAEVVSVFAEAGIRSIVLKGPSFAVWLYQLGERTYSDSDLFVSPRDIETAEELLERCGFIRWAPSDGVADRPWHAHTWIRMPDERVVDLHRTLIGATRAPEEVWSVLSGSTELIEVSGRKVEVFDEPGRALAAALHAAQDGVRQGKPIEDLSRALAVAGAETWRRGFLLAERIGAVHAFGAGLRMTRSGRETAGALGIPEEAPVEVALRASGPPPLTLGIDWLVSLRSLRQKALFIVRKLIPPAAYMRSWSPLASRGSGGLIAAYFLRIGWMIARLPGAYRAWRSAVMQARGEERHR